MKTLSILLMVSFTCGASMICGVLTPVDQPFPKPRSDHVEFKVAFDHKLEEVEETDDKEWSLQIYCSWKNISSNDVAILLKDHDSYHGTLDYVFGIQIRVLDHQGKILSATASDPEGWWSSSDLHSQLSELMPGDVVSLRPGDIVIRSFSLRDVLAGLSFEQAGDKAPILPDGTRDMTKWTAVDFAFPPGAKIEVRLLDLIARNSLTVHPKKDNKTLEPAPAAITPPAK